MTEEEVIEQVQRQQPRLVYLSGKTCTGKTTFAKYLEQHGYKTIELDKIVTASVVIPFGVEPGDGFRTAYRGLGPEEQTAAFVSAAKIEIIEKLKESSLVIDGAVATPKILRDIFSDELKDFVFVYFHPIHSEVYEERILSRFVSGWERANAGLPKDFWSLVSEKDLEEFKNTNTVSPAIHGAIKKYAERSMEESKKRLAGFQSDFSEIAVVEL